MEHFEATSPLFEQLDTKETVIYGGAFNPPTLAHIAILQACIEYAAPNQADVWVLPSGERTDKHIGVPIERRLQLVRAMVADVATRGVDVQVEESELQRTVPVETYDTAMALQAEYPERDFRWVFGADSTETMVEWKEGDWLLENLSMLVLERPGSFVNPMAKRAVALTIPSLDVSSTLLRARLAEGLSIDDQTGPHVAALFA